MVCVPQTPTDGLLNKSKKEENKSTKKKNDCGKHNQPKPQTTYKH